MTSVLKPTAAFEPAMGSILATLGPKPLQPETSIVTELMSQHYSWHCRLSRAAMMG